MSLFIFSSSPGSAEACLYFAKAKNLQKNSGAL